MKAKRARLDPKGDCLPKTRIVAHVPPGKLSFPHNVVEYELRDSDPAPTNRKEQCKR